VARISLYSCVGGKCKETPDSVKALSTIDKKKGGEHEEGPFVGLTEAKGASKPGAHTRGGNEGRKELESND